MLLYVEEEKTSSEKRTK